jgi:hypothetical protein
MKHLFTYCFLLCVAFGSAQTNEETSYSLSAGFSASGLSGSGGNRISKAGLMGEVSYIKRLNPLFSYSLGLRFIQKGAVKPPDRENGDNRLYRLTLNYIHIPFNYTFTKSGIDYYAGIAPGYLLSFKEEDENGPIRSIVNFRPIEVSGNIGARFQLSKKTKFFAQLEHSLAYVRPYIGGAFRLNRGQYNSSLIFGVSYKI